MRRLSSGDARATRAPGGFALPALALALAVGCSAVPALEEWTLQAEEIASLGLRPESQQTAFYRPRDIGVDGSGRLFVLDSGNHRVQRFAAAGTWEATIGGYGQGPGELVEPEGLWVYPDGEIVVADTGNQRLQRFGPAGDVINTTRVNYLPLDVVGTPRRIFVLRLPPPGNIFGPDNLPLVQELDRDGRPVSGHVPTHEVEPGVIYFLANTLRITATPGGGFALANTHLHSRISMYGATGELERTIPTLYKADSWAPLGRVPEVLTDDSLERVAKTSMGITWDPGRSLYWVLAGYTDRDADGSWVIGRELYRYGADGRYSGSVMLPFHGIGIAASPDNTIWVLDIDGIVHRLRIADPDVAVRR